MRTLDELIETTAPAWPIVERWVAEAKNPVRVVPARPARGAMCLTSLQVTTRSPMGAIAHRCAGIQVDDGWLRILGAGGTRPFVRGISEWNGLDAESTGAPTAGYLIVAHDAVGGFFAVNGGALDGAPGEVAYLAPDTLVWETLGMGYSAFIQWAMGDSVAGFYASMRWPGWREDATILSADSALLIYPFLWAKEGGPVEKRSRKVVPTEEIWTLTLDMKAKLGV